MECSALQDLPDHRGGPARVLRDGGRARGHVAAIHDLHSASGEEIAAEVKIVVGLIARGEAHRLLANGLGRGATDGGAKQIVGNAERDAEHGEIGIEDVEIATARHIEQ